MITGDFNLPAINWDTRFANDVFSNNFFDLLDQLGLEQLFSECTRFRHGQNPSILDLILTNVPSIVSNITFSNPFGKSDHVKICFEAQNSYVNIPREKEPKHNYYKMDQHGFYMYAQDVDWETILWHENLSTAFNSFIEEVKRIVCLVTPIVCLLTVVIVFL